MPTLVKKHFACFTTKKRAVALMSALAISRIHSEYFEHSGWHCVGWTKSDLGSATLAGFLAAAGKGSRSGYLLTSDDPRRET